MICYYFEISFVSQHMHAHMYILHITSADRRRDVNYVKNMALLWISNITYKP